MALVGRQHGSSPAKAPGCVDRLSREDMGFKTPSRSAPSGGEAVFIGHDSPAEEEWQEVIQTTIATFGRLNVLINNAGTGAPVYGRGDDRGRMGRANGTCTPKGVPRTKYAIPEMRKMEAGRSLMSRLSTAWWGALPPRRTTLPKGLSGSLTQAAAIQYAKENIRVNLGASGVLREPSPLRAIPADAQRRDWSIARTPLGRLGTADDIAYGTALPGV